jgi:hypothetical protein
VIALNSRVPTNGSKKDGRKQYKTVLHRRASGAINEAVVTPAPEMVHKIPTINGAIEYRFDNIKPALTNPKRSPRKVNDAKSSS